MDELSTQTKIKFQGSLKVDHSTCDFPMQNAMKSTHLQALKLIG